MKTRANGGLQFPDCRRVLRKSRDPAGTEAATYLATLFCYDVKPALRAGTAMFDKESRR